MKSFAFVLAIFLTPLMNPISAFAGDEVGNGGEDTLGLLLTELRDTGLFGDQEKIVIALDRSPQSAQFIHSTIEAFIIMRKDKKNEPAVGKFGKLIHDSFTQGERTVRFEGVTQSERNGNIVSFFENDKKAVINSHFSELPVPEKQMTAAHLFLRRADLDLNFELSIQFLLRKAD